MAAQKVSLYVRERSTRQLIPANPKTQYPLGTIFLIRYRRDGKRAWETLTNCPTINEYPDRVICCFDIMVNTALKNQHLHLSCNALRILQSGVHAIPVLF